MTHIRHLLNQAEAYTEAYARQYGITDANTLRAIHDTHLVHLLREARRE